MRKKNIKRLFLIIMTDKNKEVIEKLNFDDLLEDLGAEVSPKLDFRSLGKPEPGVKEDSKEEKKELHVSASHVKELCEHIEKTGEI